MDTQVSNFFYKDWMIHGHTQYPTNLSDSLANNLGLDRLVHGPLIALMLLDIAAANVPPGRSIASFSYRARHPVIVNRLLTFSGSWSSSGGQVWASNEAGRVCMTAELVLR